MARKRARASRTSQAEAPVRKARKVRKVAIGQKVRVIATRLGYYDHKRRYEGDEFVYLLREGQDLPSWMERKSVPQEEPDLDDEDEDGDEDGDGDGGEEGSGDDTPI